MFTRLSSALQAYLLLVLTTLMWAGNVVAGRLALGEVSPMVLVTLRWLFVCLILACFVIKDVRRDYPVLIASWRRIVIMSILGYTAFNSLFYIAAYYTVAANIAIFQGIIPVLVLIGASLFFGTRIRIAQYGGVVLTLIGVALVASRGHPEILSSFALNRGDAAMLMACVFYAGYTLMLPNRPAVSSLSFFTALSIAAFLTSLPLLMAEIAMGFSYWPSFEGWIITLYVAIFPSLLAQLFFIMAVERIGPGRAGLFTNLVPVFGPLLAILILKEPMLWFHSAGLALVLLGIFVAERLRLK